jgi:hypothetical protein
MVLSLSLTHFNVPVLTDELWLLDGVIDRIPSKIKIDEASMVDSADEKQHTGYKLVEDMRDKFYQLSDEDFRNKPFDKLNVIMSF